MQFFKSSKLKTEYYGQLMPGIRHVRSLVSFCLIFLLAAAAPGGAQPPSKESPATKQTAAILPPEILRKVLAEGATNLEGQIKVLGSRLSESQLQLIQTQKDWQKLRVKAAALRAILAIEIPPLTMVREQIATYSLLETQMKGQSDTLTGKADSLKEAITSDTVAENTLRMQMDALEAAGEPSVTLPETQQALSRYLQLADTRDQLAVEVWNNLEQTRKVLDQQKQLLAGLRPELNKLEEAWKTELLKRPPSRLSPREQLARLWAGLASVPGQAWNWLSTLAASGTLVVLFWDHLFHLVGLLAFLALLAWGTRRLGRRTAQWFAAWRARHAHPELLPLVVLVRVLANSLRLLGLIFWVGFLCWDSGVLGSNPAQFILYFLGAWWLLRLALALVQAFFAGEAAAGVLPLDAATARFYRRSLKVLAVYLILGALALKTAPLFHFPETARLFAEHIFLVGLVVWFLWLLRRGQISRLQPVLPDPRWVRRPGVARVLKGTVLFLLTVIVLADLLGLGNLAVYVAQAAAWTGLASLLFWFLWLIGEGIIHHLLHPELGWAPHRYPARQELVQRLYRFSRLVLSVILGAMVILWSLASWGIPASRVAWAFRWLNWGPSLGPVKLTTLNLCAAILVLYMGLWLSRLVRGLILARIFPRTGLDEGVRYTISTTVHYLAMFLAVMVALTILGFPLTNLALIAGALGVGIGFGLQNIVNNFISGLILLFERPIKVGDMLVIDGQWGTVKEIRVRSTIFETFDRYVLIIPNSELVSHKVLNWTHYGRGINRLTLKVRVASDSDVRQVTQLLTDICRANPRVVKDPPPQVYFALYGESTLDFTIYVFLNTPANRVPATHELNSAILETFQQHGIEMPFPQMDLHIKDWPGPPGKEKF